MYRAEAVYLLAGDEVVVTKAGQHPSGLDRFVASLYGQPVPGLACCAQRSGDSCQQGQSGNQVAETVRCQTPPWASKRGQNTKQAEMTLTPELLHISAMLDAFLKRVAGYIPLTHWVLDGHLGNHNALHMARQGPWHLISKRRCNAALYFPYRGP
jgi:hypothetical protein